MWVPVILSAAFLCIGLCDAYPDGVNGAGAYAYQDTEGNRYGGTYRLKDGKIFHSDNKDNFESETTVPGNFHNFNIGPPQELDDFFPAYFRNFENLLQEVFSKNVQNQNLAITAAKKAYDLTSNQAGNPQNFAPNFPPFGGVTGFGDFSDFGVPPFSMPNFGGGLGQNSAFASGVAGPGMTYQSAGISPQNPTRQNVNVMHFSDAPTPGKPQFYSVQSSSYSSSSNIDGKSVNHRGADTTVNNNGKITHYGVTN